METYISDSKQSTTNVESTKIVQSTLDSFLKRDVDDLTDKLLVHPLTLSIKCVGSLFIVQCGMKELRCGGILQVIKKKFHKEFITPDRRNTLSGKSVGIRVHRQIYHMIHCKKHTHCDCEVKTNESRLNFMTTEAFRLMNELEFTPVDSEVRLFCKKGHFGTKLDVIGYRWKGTSRQVSTIISLKTSKASSNNRSNGVNYLSHPYQDVKSTTRNHNQLQALGELMILEKEYGMKFKSYFIFYLTADGTSKYETPDEWWGDLKKKNEFYDALCKRITKPKTKKRSEPKRTKEKKSKKIIHKRRADVNVDKVGKEEEEEGENVDIVG